MDTAHALDAESAAHPRWLSAGLPLLAGGAVAGGLALLHFRDPHVQGSYGICPFKELTGWWCPGCGGLRGLHNLTEGHVLDAIHSNILLFPLLLGFLAWWGTWVVRGFQGRTPPPRLPQVLPKSAMWVTVAFLFLYTVLRNTPWGTWLAPV
ncbi:DUF2752 domain-containing protein [Nocardia sp. NBC_01503]|uniref:DUF2752 domain-containing protein n=1 Tax=Nocardia sp. NBC_01503 TaxID=2975997 RepID=UPI002E7B25AD|nr:DUF2752 domain-containing protein [Nocardia sp. NBC_01503]WTL34397.1 DUF2752 domain-containing protein [Nocardia sp. NBC_01503]